MNPPGVSISNKAKDFVYTGQTSRAFYDRVFLFPGAKKHFKTRQYYINRVRESGDKQNKKN